MYHVSTSQTHVYHNYNPAKGKWPASSGTGGIVNVNVVAHRPMFEASVFLPGLTNRATRQAQWNGKLSKLMDMPVDILFEVFGRLHPTDLLNLSRTSKAYRRFLTDRGSANLWRVSFQNVPGTPEPFEEMSFPAWAHLLFCDQCHFCDFRPSNIDWTFKIRACTRCVHTVLNVTHTKVPKTVHPRSMAARVFRDRIHTNLCKSWYLKKDAESPEKIKEDRLAKIKSKLSALGWGTQAQTYVERAAVLRPIVTRPQKFTDEVWEEIGPYIVSHLEDRERQGLSFDLKVSAPKVLEQRWDAHRMSLASQFWRNYRAAHYDPAIQDLPSGLEFVSLKPVVEILRCPKHVVVTLESFYCLIPLIPEMIKSWRENMRMLEG